MANGIACKHCGWSESTHIEADVDEPDFSNRGEFTHSLATCPGYKPERISPARAMNSIEKKHLERQASVCAYIPPRV